MVPNTFRGESESAAQLPLDNPRAWAEGDGAIADVNNQSNIVEAITTGKTMLLTFREQWCQLRFDDRPYMRRHLREIVAGLVARGERLEEWTFRIDFTHVKSMEALFSAALVDELRALQPRVERVVLQGMISDVREEFERQGYRTDLARPERAVR